MPSSDSVGLNPRTFSVSGALSASETEQLSSLTSVLVSRSSEVQVSPSLPLSPPLSRDALLFTSRTIMTARTTLTTIGTMYTSTGLAIDSSQVSSRSQASNVLPLPPATLKGSSDFVSSRSTSFIASFPKNLSRTFSAPESVSLKTRSSNLNFSSLTLFQERTLSSKSSFFKPPPTSFVLPTAKFTSTNISRTVNDPFSVLPGVSSTALSLSSLASFQGSTLQPSLRRPSSSDFISSQSTLSISTSPSLDFRSTLNVSDSRLSTEDSPGLFSSSRKPFQESSLTSQPRVPRHSATGIMSSNTFIDTQSVLHRQNSTSLNFVLSTSLQGSTVSPKSSPLSGIYSPVSTLSQYTSSFPRSLNLSSGLSNRNSVLHVATSVIFSSAVPSKESSLFTMFTSTKVSSSGVFNDLESLNSFSSSTALSGTPLIYSSMTLSLTPTVRLSLNLSVFMASSVDENSRVLSPTMSRPTMNASSLIETRVTRTSLFMVPSYTTPLATISVTKTSRSDSSSTVPWALNSTAVSQNLTRLSTAVWKNSTTLLFKLTSIGMNQTSLNVAASSQALSTPVFSDISKRTIERGSTIGTMSTYKVSRDTISSLRVSVFPSISLKSSSSSLPALHSAIISVTTSMRPSLNKTSVLDLATLQGSHTASLIANGTTRPKLRTSRVKLSSLTGDNISSSSAATLLASSGVTTTSVATMVTQALRLSELRTVGSAASSSRRNFPTSSSVPLIILSTLTPENTTSPTTVSPGASVDSSIQRISAHSTLTSHLSKGFPEMTSSPKVQVNISEIGFASTLRKPATRITAEESRPSSLLSLAFTVGYITTGSKETKGTSSVFSASLVSPMTSFDVKNNLSSLSTKAEVDTKTRGTSARNLVSSSTATVQKSSGLSFSKSLLPERTRVLPSLDSSVLDNSGTFSPSLSVSIRLETSMLLNTGSGLLPSMTALVEESSSLLKRGLTYSTTGTPARLSLQTLSSPVISSRLPLSSLLQARSSLPPLLPPSVNPTVTFTSEVSVELSTTGLLKTDESSTTMPHSFLVSLPTTHEDTSLSTISASSVSKSPPAAFWSVEPTEPVVITRPNTTESEGLVGIQILVPKTQNETEPAFKESIELGLAAAYRWGREKANTRAKRDLERINLVGPALSWNGRSYNSWKQSPSFKVYQRRARRFRRQVDSIVAVIEVIRRAKPIVGEEVVDIEYRMFNGLTLLSAEDVVQTMDKLSEAELVTTLKYPVTLRPYVVKEVPVTPAPTSASKWDILIPAILVPVCVALFLLIALIGNKCASKRERKRQKIEPTEEEDHRYETLQIRTFPSVNVVPPKNMGPPKKKRLSISSASSSDIPSKCPSVPPPDYSPGPSVTPQKPNQQYRRRAHGKHGDFKYGGQSYNGKVVVNGHIQYERALKKSQDERDSAKTDHPAGVLENRPLMRNERLTNSLTREEPSVKFTSLPPLVKTSLVGPKAAIRNTATSERKDYARTIAESGVPQEGFGKMIATERHYVPLAKLATINEEVTFKEKEDALFLKAKIERWRNKMRHREKLRLEQDLREKEHEEQRIPLQQLKKGRKEESEKSRTEDQASSSQRSLNAERKRRSRLERWRNNRVGTSSSKSSSSHSSGSSSSSSASESDSDSKKKQGKHKEKRRKKKMKKGKKKVPPLAVGHAAKASAQEALRESAWTIKETPGVQLISVKPINEQRDRTQYLLDTGYQIYPMASNPSFEPRQRDDGEVYENMEGRDPYFVQYSDDYLPAPRQAFGGPPVHEDEHIYDEPRVIATSPSQTHLVVSPRDDQTRAMVPIRYAPGFTGRSSPMSRGRPASAASHPGLTKRSGTRPTSARTDPMPRYAPPPGRTSPENRAFAGPTVPGSRCMLANQPTVATASQPSIGTSPRYMVDPERQRDQPPSSFQGARMILSRAQSNIDSFEDDSKRNVLDETDVVPASESLYMRPQKRAPSHACTIRKEPSPKGTSRLDVTAREHAELEAQLLVSRALARARNNSLIVKDQVSTEPQQTGSDLQRQTVEQERHKEMHSSRKGTMNVMQFLTKKSIVSPLQRTSNKTNKKKEKKKSKNNSRGSSSSSSSSDEIEKKMKSENYMEEVSRENGHS
ncbi:hypothetical protein P5673_010519 [Acropora cervicornis]|uniref:Uncharacterized protein n=1 Tax=Acropora cervicornis TaxID=6130 RepID=A0AAD9V8R0_ACRCE|nr:hypothetical protein P5673_010519 [Acropora cervicornis]